MYVNTKDSNIMKAGSRPARKMFVLYPGIKLSMSTTINNNALVLNSKYQAALNIDFYLLLEIYKQGVYTNK